MNLAQNRFFDQFAIDNHEAGVSLCESLQDPFGMGDGGVIAREKELLSVLDHQDRKDFDRILQKLVMHTATLPR